MIRRWTTPRTTPSPVLPNLKPASSTSIVAERSVLVKRSGAIAVLFILSLALSSTAAAADWKPAPNPPNCPANYRCLSIDDYTHMTARMATLDEDLKAERKKRKHFGIGATLGPSLGLVVDEELHTKVVPSAASIAVGLTIKF